MPISTTRIIFIVVFSLGVYSFATFILVGTPVVIGYIRNKDLPTTPNQVAVAVNRAPTGANQAPIGVSQLPMGPEAGSGGPTGDSNGPEADSQKRKPDADRTGSGSTGLEADSKEEPEANPSGPGSATEGALELSVRLAFSRVVRLMPFLPDVRR